MSARFSKTDWFFFSIFGVLVVLVFWGISCAMDDCMASQCPSGTQPVYILKAGCYCAARPK